MKSFALGIILLWSGLCPATPDIVEWPFNVYLDDQLVGAHRFKLKGAGDLRTIESVAQFDVRFLGIGVYHYDHVSNESWKLDCLDSIHAKTDDNGAKVRVDGVASPDTFSLQVDGNPQTLPHCIMTFAYWNPVMLRQKQLLNPQTGELTPITIRALGRDVIKVGTEDRPADHFLLVAPKYEIDLWYDLKGQWVALDSRLDHNRKLKYRLDHPS